MNGTMRAAAESEITIVGGGIGGLALALNLHKHKISCRVYEAADRKSTRLNSSH